MNNYILKKIPTSLGVTRQIRVKDLDAAKLWATDNIRDKSARWIITLDGRNLANAFSIHTYKVDGLNGKIRVRVKGSLSKSDFTTKQQALNDYNKHKLIANKRLEVLALAFMEFQDNNDCYVSYVMEGDTHGIHEDYLYISVKQGSYVFRKDVRN